jgi:hypothetical protein
MSHVEWRSLPWWVRQVYIEGMIEEELLSEGPPDRPAFEVDPLGTDTGSFQSQGFTVIDGG